MHFIPRITVLAKTKSARHVVLSPVICYLVLFARNKALVNVRVKKNRTV